MANEKDRQFAAAISDTPSELAVETAKSLLRTIYKLTDGENAIERAAEWINDNLEPMDIFSREKLEAWAKMNGWAPPQP